jgi:hypothetical protein
MTESTGALEQLINKLPTYSFWERDPTGRAYLRKQDVMAALAARADPGAQAPQILTSQKVNLPNLREACRKMIQLIDKDLLPEKEMGWGKLMAFANIGNDIRYELDGADSCIPEVRQRALRDHGI